MGLMVSPLLANQRRDYRGTVCKVEHMRGCNRWILTREFCESRRDVSRTRFFSWWNRVENIKLMLIENVRVT